MGGLAADAEYVAALVQRLLGMLSADRYGDRCICCIGCSVRVSANHIQCSACHCFNHTWLR